jgi:hypothetical protein
MPLEFEAYELPSMSSQTSETDQDKPLKAVDPIVQKENNIKMNIEAVNYVKSLVFKVKQQSKEKRNKAK